MARHSKWANIKHKKEAAGKVKGKAFSLIAKEIVAAAMQERTKLHARNFSRRRTAAATRGIYEKAGSAL